MHILSHPSRIWQRVALHLLLAFSRLFFFLMAHSDRSYINMYMKIRNEEYIEFLLFQVSDNLHGSNPSIAVSCIQVLLLLAIIVLYKRRLIRNLMSTTNYIYELPHRKKIILLNYFTNVYYRFRVHWTFFYKQKWLKL